MESWRKVWRDGLAPLLSTHQLNVLRDALAKDDPRLIQGANTVPPPMQCVLDWPCEGGCLIAYPFAFEDGEDDDGKAKKPVGEADEHFVRVCFAADQRLGEPTAVRYLLNWFDDTPRDEMRRELLAEVDRILNARLVAA